MSANKLEYITWEETPYKGVFISRIAEPVDLDNPTVPRYTLMMVKIDPECSIPSHRHIREIGWTETLIFAHGGNFEIYNDDTKEVLSRDPSVLTVTADETFGIRNRDCVEALVFTSLMQPGFTGYGEIEEVS